MVFVIEYRLAPPNPIAGQVSDGRYPDQKNDVKLAVHAARVYSGSTGKVGTVGGSAGGTHALEVAEAGTLTNEKVNAAVSISGPTEFNDPASLSPPSNSNFKDNVENYVFNTYPTVPAEPTYSASLLAASPISRVDASVSPMFLIDAASDTMPPNQRLHMVAALDAVPVTNYQTLQVADGAHSFANWDACKVQVIAFLRANLVSGGAPAITNQPVSKTVNTGQRATFSVIASGSAPLSYQWRKGGTDIPAETGSSYTTPVTVIGDNGSVYSVVVTNDFGTVTSANATLTVTPFSTPPPVGDLRIIFWQ
jgi:dienelactone hydrolase